MWSTNTLGSSFQYLSYYLTLLIGASMLLTIRNQALRGEFLVEADPHPVSQPEERQYQLCGKNPTVFRKLGNAFSRLSSKSEQRCMIYGRARSLALNCAFFISFFWFHILCTFYFYVSLNCSDIVVIGPFRTCWNLWFGTAVNIFNWISEVLSMFLERINGMSIGYERIEIVMKTQAAHGLTCLKKPRDVNMPTDT